jgi:phenylacetate-CoA ligase
MSVGFARPFSAWSLDRLFEAVKETEREFGTIDAEGVELLSGPTLDDETRREVQLRRFRTQAKRAARQCVYYEDLFERLGLDPARISFEDIARIPPTSKEALQADPGAFVSRDSSPIFCTTTTGTTGKPTSVCFSAYEMQTYIGLASIGLLLSNSIAPSDIVQINTSSRATLGNACFAGACTKIGAMVRPVGLIEAPRTLVLLTEKQRIPAKKPQVSYLNTYPSYLGELVENGLRLGYVPSDFGLERIGVGGELVSEGLKARARRLFGDDVQFDEGYGMTETWPLPGRRCSEGHLHFEPLSALLEVLALDTKVDTKAQEASPGEAGTIVATSLPPYRDTTILLRYDTQDVARPLAPKTLRCELRDQPATSPLLGKLRLAACHEDGYTFPRDVLEALEEDDNVPLPARYGFWAVPEGVGVEVVARGAGPSIRRAIGARLEERGVPVRELRLVECRSELRHPVPLRCDLREISFNTPGASTNTIVGLGLSEPETRGS